MDVPVNQIYESLEGNSEVSDYHFRHKVDSLCILTIYEPKKAKKVVELYKSSIVDKVVIEIGAGIGLFALESAKYAKEVFAIEADPAWTWVFIKYLYREKPPNLTWIFGVAEAMINRIYGDVCFVFTHSAQEQMMELAKNFAPKTINGYYSWQETDKAKAIQRKRFEANR